jgi:hypothetical protein
MTVIIEESGHEEMQQTSPVVLFEPKHGGDEMSGKIIVHLALKKHPNGVPEAFIQLSFWARTEIWSRNCGQ